MLLYLGSVHILRQQDFADFRPPPPSVSNFTLGHTIKITVASALANPPPLPLAADVICERSLTQGKLKLRVILISQHATLNMHTSLESLPALLSTSLLYL